MTIKNEFNSKNAGIRNGNYHFQTDINNEIYGNLDQIENTYVPQKEKIDRHELNIRELNDKVNSNNGSISNIISNELPNKQEQLNKHAGQILELDEKIKNFNIESLKGLSQHFRKNYVDMSTQSNDWLKRLLGTWYIGAMGWGLVLQMGLISVFLYYSNLKFLYLLIPYNIIYISLLYFITSQYSHYKRLALDAKNREVVSESYIAVLNNSNHEDEKNIITKIVADTLFSRSVVDSGAELPIKEAVRIVEKVLER